MIMLITIYQCNFFLLIHIFTCIFIIETICILLEFTTKKKEKKNLYIGVLEYVMNTCGSWF